MPAELQERVHEEVKRTRQRSGWPARPLQVYEALPEEKEAVVAYARERPGIRHRELAWRMVDEDEAYLSASAVYRVLREAQLICPWKRREKRYRDEWEKAKRCDARWATDILQLNVGEEEYYLVAFMDEYSRYIVHHELLISMDGATVSLAAQAAVETLGRKLEEWDWEGPEIRSDNGSGYISHEFRDVLREHGLSHHRIRPHCPEENGLIERVYRTFRKALDGEELRNLLQARDVLKRIVRWYNEERLHSALGYLRPADYYLGNPEHLQVIRRTKLAQTRHARCAANLNIRQRTLPLTGACPEFGKCTPFLSRAS